MTFTLKDVLHAANMTGTYLYLHVNGGFCVTLRPPFLLTGEYRHPARFILMTMCEVKYNTLDMVPHVDIYPYDDQREHDLLDFLEFIDYDPDTDDPRKQRNQRQGHFI